MAYNRNRKPGQGGGWGKKKPAIARPTRLQVREALSKLTPSTYQAAVLDFVKSGRGHGFVDAVAGAGKTSTLKLIAAALETDDAQFFAFNAHIRDELLAVLPDNVTVSTIHQAGRAICAYFLRQQGVEIADVDEAEKKYSRLVREFMLASKLDTDDDVLFGALRDLVKFAMSQVIDPRDLAAIEDLLDAFDIDVLPTVAFRALPWLMERGVEEACRYGLVTFDEMVWLPLHKKWKPRQRLWVLVDEAQDLTPAQRQLVMAHISPRGGRAVFVGDPQQAIYAFAGADARSVQQIITTTGAHKMPLSICYRCPKSHVALAQQIVPHIEAAPNAPEGIVADIESEKLATVVREGDLILCRTTAPLVKRCLEFIGANIPARIKGRDVGAGLVKLVKKVQKISGAVRVVDFLGALDAQVTAQVEVLGATEGNDGKITALFDSSAAIRAIAEGTAEKTVDGLITAIEGLFTDGRPSITLSTVHKAKGLENDRVFILEPGLMPHPMAKTPTQREQEMNIKYIALTRAKRELYFVV